MGTHKELITALKFDESFKNAMRDYYNYGFKKYNVSDSTRMNDWRRLNSILSNYVKWIKKGDDDERMMMYVSTDSRAQKENPFHRVYRFCKTKHLGYFLHTICMFANPIWNDSYINREMDHLVHKDWDIAFTEAIDNTNNPLDLFDYIDNLGYSEQVKDKLKKAVLHGICLKSSQMAVMFPGEYATGKDANKTVNNRLSKLNEIGIIECEQGKGNTTGKINGDKYWRKRECTIDKLIEAGLESNEKFVEHFLWALDFFSRYSPFGEFGVFMQDRMGISFVDKSYDSPFRFKGDYFMQALNDFNLIDLLGAIERNEWCYIKYKHAIKEKVDTTLLCYPLEIRCSSLTGRQMLMFYEPFHRCCTGLRIEFIDKIICIKNDDVIRIIEKKDFGKREIENDIFNSRDLLNYVWGVSTSRKQSNNAVYKAEPVEVSFSILVDSEGEYYIRNRLERECRKGCITMEGGTLKFRAKIVDPDEMRTWIRSFYSRIISCEGVLFDGKTYKSDAKLCNDKWNDDIDENNPEIRSWGIESTSNKWGIEDPNIREWLKKIDDSGNDHERMFNEIFCVYAHLLSSVMESLCIESDDDNAITDDDLNYCILNCLGVYEEISGKKTKKLINEEVKRFIIESGLIKKNGENYVTAYKVDNTEWYKTLIPLTLGELRWLKSIMLDEKIGYFLSEEEVRAVTDWISRANQYINEYPFDKVIYYYDKYHMKSIDKEKEKMNFEYILTAITNNKKIIIGYFSEKNKCLTGEFIPIIVEYSKLNDRFQLYAISCEEHMVYMLNLQNIIEVHITEEMFDREKIDDEFEDYVNSSKENVVIRFSDTNNLPDRLLTEFSPLEKECVYNANSRTYELTIYYQKYDELEVTVRLMSYGSAIQFVNKEHAIANEIKRRLKKQLELNDIRESEEKNR